jgi:hypothetical protein
VNIASPGNPPPFRHTGPAAWLLLAALLATAAPTPAQPSATDANRTVEEVAGEPFIDRNVGSVLERLSAWLARMKKEHFTAYLMVYTAVFGTAAGGIYGFLAFRFGDAMAPYRRIRNKTGLLSLAIGLGLGVFVAVTQIPPTIVGKVSMLLLTIACALVTTTFSTLALFVTQRWFMVARARRSGFPLSGRLRVP